MSTSAIEIPIIRIWLVMAISENDLASPTPRLVAPKKSQLEPNVKVKGRKYQIPAKQTSTNVETSRVNRSRSSVPSSRKSPIAGSRNDRALAVLSRLTCRLEDPVREPGFGASRTSLAPHLGQGDSSLLRAAPQWLHKNSGIVVPRESIVLRSI